METSFKIANGREEVNGCIAQVNGGEMESTPVIIPCEAESPKNDNIDSVHVTSDDIRSSQDSSDDKSSETTPRKYGLYLGNF